MGRASAESFTRLYLIPGANHGSARPAFAPSWDSVTALEKWAEQGTRASDGHRREHGYMGPHATTVRVSRLATLRRQRRPR